MKLAAGKGKKGEAKKGEAQKGCSPAQEQATEKTKQKPCKRIQPPKL